jgi:hypothetical protein
VYKVDVSNSRKGVNSSSIPKEGTLSTCRPSLEFVIYLQVHCISRMKCVLIITCANYISSLGCAKYRPQHSINFTFKSVRITFSPFSEKIPNFFLLKLLVL